MADLLDVAVGDAHVAAHNAERHKINQIQSVIDSGGFTGPAGADGATWILGGGAPSSVLGKVTDLYLNTMNDDYYKKTGPSTWTFQGTLKGSDGADGTAGTNGTNGTNGSNGTNGATWYTGTGAPSGATGVVNDLYLNTANGDYYKKTGASTWTLQANLTGPVATTIAASVKTADYTLALTDPGTVIEVNSTTAKTVTVPTNASVAIPIGSVLYVHQYGTGQVTIAPASGVTIRTSSSYTTRAQYSTVMLRKRATDEWVLSGDLT